MTDRIEADPPAPRNRFVLRNEPAGTGYRAMMILAPARDLLDLADRLRAVAEQGDGSIADLVAREHEPGSRGAFGFRVVSEEELSALQQSRLHTRLRALARLLFWVVVLPLAGHGGCALVR